MFADDTCLFIDVDNREDCANKLNDDLARINLWSKKWIVNFSPKKTKSLIVSTKKDPYAHFLVYLDGNLIEEVKTYSYLGLTFSKNLKWSVHINEIALKARKRLSAMIPLKNILDRKSLHTMYLSFIRPVMDYDNIVWGYYL